MGKRKHNIEDDEDEVENQQFKTAKKHCIRDESNLTDENELALIKKLASFMRSIEMAVANFEPHRLAFYLQELSAEFHGLWNKGIENQNLKFILKDNFETSFARIYLILALKKIIAQCLDIFNIKALEEMR